MRLLAVLLVLACDAAPETCPSGIFEASFATTEVDCPELGPVVAQGGADPLGPPLGGHCEGLRAQHACSSRVDLSCTSTAGQYRFAGSLAWEGTGDAVLTIAGRTCHYTIAGRRR